MRVGRRSQQCEQEKDLHSIFDGEVGGSMRGRAGELMLIDLFMSLVVQALWPYIKRAKFIHPPSPCGLNEWQCCLLKTRAMHLVSGNTVKQCNHMEVTIIDLKLCASFSLVQDSI